MFGPVAFMITSTHTTHSKARIGIYKCLSSNTHVLTEKWSPGLLMDLTTDAIPIPSSISQCSHGEQHSQYHNV